MTKVTSTIPVERQVLNFGKGDSVVLRIKLMQYVFRVCGSSDMK